MSDSQTSANAQPVAAGDWIVQSINGMQYEVLLPANYDPTIKYPTVLYLHQLDMGDWPAGLLQEVNPWFNNTTFRTDHPSIVVMPLLDQTADTSGGTINFGGVGTADSAGEVNAIAALQQVMAQYSSDPTRVYVTGNSMGGIGTEDMIIKYNAYTGTEGKIFAAGLSLAGADYGQGYPQPSRSVVAALKNVPFWAIHGGQDTTVPLTWDQNLYAAEQASGGDMIYTQDNSLGHDVWDTYYPQTGAGSPLGWLFSQRNGGAPPPPSSPPSLNDTVVKAGSAAAITDAAGNAWTINAAAQVAVNGTADTTTGNVIELAYVGGAVWQENASHLWWGTKGPAAGWSLGGGTSSSPPPPPPPPPSPNDTVVKAGSAAAITDAAGNAWTINAAAQVAVNGTADTTTGNVIELAYVGGAVWQENASHLWWGTNGPAAGWSLGGGTSSSPLPPPTVIPPNQANVTVSQSHMALVARGGSHMVFISGSNDAVNLSGGTDTISDTGHGNTYVVPPAGRGYDNFTTNILNIGDTLDLRSVLAATNWNGAAATLSNYLTVTDNTQGMVLSVAATSGGAPVGIASIAGATTAKLSTLLVHALT